VNQRQSRNVWNESAFYKCAAREHKNNRAYDHTFVLLDVAIKICLAYFFIIQEQAEIKFSKYFDEYVFLKVDRYRTLIPCDRSIKCGSGST
jgi:hypothetical protein